MKVSKTELKAPRWFLQWYLNNCQLPSKLDQVKQVNQAYRIYLKGKRDQRASDKEKTVDNILKDTKHAQEKKM